MNPGALPPALSELFLAERASNGERADQARPANSTDPSAHAERFERYLSSARRSVGRPSRPTEAADETRTSGVDHRGSGVDRRSGPERSMPGRDDHRRADDRPVDGRERRDRAAGRDRIDVDDRPVDRIDDRAAGAERSEGPGATSPSGSRSAAASTVTSTTDPDAPEATPTTEPAATGDRPTDALPIAATIAPAMPTEAVDPDEVADGTSTTGIARTGDGTAPIVEAITVSAGVDAGEGNGNDGVSGPTEASEPDETSGADVVDDRAVRTVDPSTVEAAAVTAAGDRATAERRADPTASAEDAVVDPDRPGLDQLGPAPGGETATDGAATATGTDAELDPTEGGPGADGGDPTADAGAGADGDADPSSGDGGRSGDGTVPTDGPDAVAASPTAGASGSAAATSNPMTGVDAVAGPSGPRNRSTATTTSTQGAQTTQAPLVDGEAGDPLWLQVRRAMGSLRTLQNGEQQMTIRLRPAELGSVMVRVNAGEQGTTISLVADSALAANQLTQQRQQLIGELERGGLADVAVDVGTGGDTDLRDGADGEERDASGGTEADGSAAAAVAGGLAAARTGGRGRRAGASTGGLLDVEL